MHHSNTAEAAAAAAAANPSLQQERLDNLPCCGGVEEQKRSFVADFVMSAASVVAGT